MTAADRLADCIGGELGKRLRETGDTLRELRIRVGKPARLCMMDGSERTCVPVSAQELQRMLARMMEDSLYACEEELRQGYFTMTGGLRVGVCGRMNAREGRVSSLGSIGSICIRIPREARGCAQALFRGAPESMLILSPPGMGKTTLLRDYVRLASEAGWNVAIADERREIAACREGVPQFDVGPRTDVMDGCPKAIAIAQMVRSCAPQLIAADEIGGSGEGEALLDAARCGAAVVATAHAGGFADAEARFSALLGPALFRRAVLLGPEPGKILAVREYKMEGAWDAEGLAADIGAGRLRGRGTDAVQRETEEIGAAG